MLSAHPRDQSEESAVLPHHSDTPPRTSSLESMTSTTPNTTNTDRSFLEKQHWQKQQRQQQYQAYENDERASITTTHSRPFFMKQPWQKTAEHHSIERKSSSESIRSNVSTTSSIFSTASKISKLPHVVKNSVKGLVAKSASTSRRLTLMSHNGNNNNNNNKNGSNNTTTTTTPLNLTASSSAYYQTSPPPSSLVSSSSSFGYRLRKRTPSALGLSNMFSRRRASMDQAVGAIDQVHPQESISYSVLKEEPYQQRPSMPSSSSLAMRKTASSSSSSSSIGSVATNGPPTLHHRLSRLHLSSSSTPTSPPPHTNSGATASPVSTATSPLPVSSSSNLATATTVNTATTAPSVTSPVGRLLFGKEVTSLFDTTDGDDDTGAPNDDCVIQDDSLSTQMNGDIEPTLDVTQKHPDHHQQKQQQQQQPYHMFLVTATLTTLRTKLLADCDRTLATSLQHPTPPFPTDDLKSIMQDLRQMSDMVGHQKQSSDIFVTLDDKIKDQAPVREITSLMKQVIHDDVCQYYKVYENSMVIPCKGYKIEGKNKFGTKPPATTISTTSSPDDGIEQSTYSTSIVEHMDQQTHWFRTYFIQHGYSTFCGYDDEKEPILITTSYDPVFQLYRVITRVKQGPDRRDEIQDSFLLNAPPVTTSSHHHTSDDTSSHHEQHQHEDEQKHPLETTSAIDILDTTWKVVIESSSAIPLIDVPFNRLKKITQDVMESSGLENDILKLDENGIHTRYKFGVLYVKEGQTKEEEWFANEHDSSDLDRFLTIIGQRVPLLGYSGWTAGLDTKTSDSGEFTYVNTWQEHSIAYHVSTLLPSSQGDKQQIQRKRHIGNDIVCLVFVEGKQPFNPAAIKSQFLHVFIVVHKEEWKGVTNWRVEVATIESVPSFGPALPEGGVFFNETDLQSFLLAKLINAEYAALKSPKFAQPLTRAREGILTNIVEKGYKLAQDPDVRTLHSRHSKSPSTSSERSSRSSKSNHHHHHHSTHQELDSQQQQQQQQNRGISPTPSRSSMIKELSEGVTGLGRRRSTQDSAENRQKAKQARRKAKGISGTKQNRSESELLKPVEAGQGDLRTSKSSESVSPQSQQQGSLKTNSKKDGFKHRAHNIFNSFSSKRQQHLSHQDGPSDSISSDPTT